MAIGFMSFGGMLTGGDDAPKKEVVENVTPAETVEVNEVATDSTALETVTDSLTQTVQQ
jgi:Na+-transporting NADH:ubiquinone oxidoreductase subunit E